jgi:hypothetical protein
VTGDDLVRTGRPCTAPNDPCTDQNNPKLHPDRSLIPRSAGDERYRNNEGDRVLW